MKVFPILLFSAVIYAGVHGFCGDRKQTGDLVRSAVRAAEWIRSSLVSGTPPAGQEHVRAAAYHSLRLVGYEMKSDDVAQLKANLDKVGIANLTIGRLAYFVNGILASCRDPSDFYGYNLINPLIQGIEGYPIAGSFHHPFQYSLAVQALCNSNYLDGTPVDYTLLGNVSVSHFGDTQSMATMALSCVYMRLKSNASNTAMLSQVADDLGKATARLLALQKPDGSFGNSVTTAKVVQALLSAGAKPSDWNCHSAMAYLLSRQKPAGSFQFYVASTMQVMPALIGAVPHDIVDISCRGKPLVYPRHVISVCVKVEFLTTSPQNTSPTPPSPVTLKVLNGTNAHDLLKMAALKHPCYQFTTKMTAYGHSVQSICGVITDGANKKYWLIYKDASTWAPSGIDTFTPADGSCVIFKYAKLNF